MLKVIAKGISFLPISPNVFTTFAIPLAGTAAYFLYTESYLLATLFILLSVFIDFLDGSFAEVKGKKSYFGNYFDAVTDKIVEAIIYLGFSFHYPLVAFICFANSILLSYAKPRVALVIETDNHDWPAIGERADRLILLLLGLVLANFVEYKDWDFVFITLVIVSVLTFIGFIQRILYARNLIRKADKNDTILSYLKKK